MLIMAGINYISLEITYGTNNEEHKVSIKSIS